MATLVTGQLPCPYCQKPCNFGIDRDGKGRSSRLVCYDCNLTIQFRRVGNAGIRMEQEATGNKATEHDNTRDSAADGEGDIRTPGTSNGRRVSDWV